MGAHPDSVEPAVTRGEPEAPLRLHRRQFVLGPERTEGRPDWLHERVGEAWLSRCPELRALRLRDAEGVEWWLLGRALGTDPKQPSPAEDVRAARTRDVPGARVGWAGRWVLIGAGRVYPDATALLGVLYARSNGALWVASSPTLLAERVEPAGPSPRLYYDIGLSWHPLPASAHPRIRQLLPSQYLRLEDGSVGHAAILPPGGGATDHESRLAEYRIRVVTALRGLCAEAGEPPWLGLTAGGDSRLMLALARAESLEVRTFTWLSPRTTPADRRLPPEIAAAAGVSHRFLPDRGRNRGRTRWIDAHAGASVSRGDALPLLRGSRSELRGVSLGGHFLNLLKPKGYWRLRTLPAEPASAAEAARLLRAFVGERPDSAAGQALRAWAEWAFRYPEPGLDWRDRFYLEQRMAGWLAAKEQLFDLAPLERVMPLNAAVIHALVLGFDDEWRHRVGVHAELIRRAAPELLAWPFNPPASTFGAGEALRAGARGWARSGWRWVQRARKRLTRGRA